MGFLEHKEVNGELLIYSCLDCAKYYYVKFNNQSKKRFANTCKFCDGDPNPF